MEVPGEGCHLARLAPHRLEKEIEVLENADMPPASSKENVAAPSPSKEAQKAEVMLNSHQVRRFRGPQPLLWPDFSTKPILPLPSHMTCGFASLGLLFPH